MPVFTKAHPLWLQTPGNLQRWAQPLKEAVNQGTNPVRYEGIIKKKKKISMNNFMLFNINNFQDVFQLKMVKWTAKLAFEIQGATRVAQV